MKKLEMKKINFNFASFVKNLIRKYDYNYNNVIGVIGDERFILYAKRKLIRIYRDKLKSKALLSTYIPIEKAIFYNFEVEKSVLEKVDLTEFVEAKIYEEAGVDETEKYLIKYKVIDSLKDEKNVIVESVVVSEAYVQTGYKNIVEETGYIDYISFPAFAYKALYEENIIKKANDLFVVFLYDKLFLTFYTEGELLSIVTVSGGLEKIFDELAKLKIKNFDLDLFEKILTKKGLNPLKYSQSEKVIFDILKQGFLSFITILNQQIDKVSKKYNLSSIERIFVISEYGQIEGLEKFIQNNHDFIQSNQEIETFGFEFYEEYNLDRLAVDPFLFLGMLEAHTAYKNNIQEYNFSVYLRRPTFFYRPSGKLFLVTVGSIIVLGAYPLYLYIDGMMYESKNNGLRSEVNKFDLQIKKLKGTLKKLVKKEKEIVKQRDIYADAVSETKKYIKGVYEFKYSYIPKSEELTDITLLMNKDKVYLENLNYSNGVFSINVFSFKETQIPKFLNDLVNAGFNVQTDGVIMKKNKYYATVRIEE